MDRNRDTRRSGSLLISSNGSSRRRHKRGLRDSPDEDGQIELRERVKKDQDRDREKDREKDRERERSYTVRSNKRRRGENMMIHNNRGDDGGEDTSEENVNYEEDDDHNNQNHHRNSTVIGGGGVRLSPKLNSVAAPAASPVSSHYLNGNINNNNTHNSNYSNTTNNNTNHQHENQHLQTRKSIPPSEGKVFRAAPVWKSDEMIGVSVPRKARSASTKRSHDWMFTNTVGGVSVTPATDFPEAPLSPSCSNASAKKKIKQNGPLKSALKTSSLNPEELEIEIAEVLFGLKTQSQAPLKKEIVFNDSVEINRSSIDAKSRVSSPVSNSPSANIQSSLAALPNSCSSGGGSFTAVAPKRKKPRHVTEIITGSFSVRSSPVSMKVETDQSQTPKRLEKIDENGVCKAKSDVLPPEQNMPEQTRKDLESKPVAEAEGLGESPDVVSNKESVNSLNKEIPAKATECIRENVGVTVTALASVTMSIGNSVASVTQMDEKFQIDLEASPLCLRSSPPERGEMVPIEQEQLVSKETKPLVVKEIADAYKEDLKLKVCVEESENRKSDENKKRNGDLEKQEKDNILPNKLIQQTQKLPSKSAKEEPQPEKTGLSSSLPMPSWPIGLSPMGYVAPIQGVVTMDGSTVSSPAPVKAMVKQQARPKRCATHCHIARNIHYLQRFTKSNPFWQQQQQQQPPASKPCDFSAFPKTNGDGSISGGRVASNVVDKAAPVISEQNNVVDVVSKRNHQSLTHVAPNNMLNSGPAFFFQQAAAAAQSGTVAAAVAKPATTYTSGTMVSSSAPSSTTAMSGSSTVSFSFQNMPVANLQNNYPYTIPTAVAAAATTVTPPNHRGGAHSQPMPMFNGSFYSSQIIHPSQHQQPVSQSSHKMQQSLQNSNMSSGSLPSSHKHQRPSGPSIPSGNGGVGNRQLQKSHQRMENEVVAPEDSLSTGDSRSRAAPVSIYGQHMHSQNYALMTSSTPAASTTSSGSNNQNEKKLPQHQTVKTATESLPQTFDVSFTSINGAHGFDISSVAQNPAFLQSLRESTRHNIQMITAANAQIIAQQKKYVRNNEESPVTLSNSQLSDASAAMAANNINDSSSRSLAWPARTSVSNATGSERISNAQLLQMQQQMMNQLQQQMQQQKQQFSSSMASANAMKLSNPQLSCFPQNIGNNQAQSSPQWKNPVRNSTSQSPSALKNHPPQQNRGHQSHTQISFGSTQKSASGGGLQGQPPPLSSINQSPSSPMMVGSPTTSSMSKGAGGSPRTTASVSGQQSKNSSVPAQVSSFSPQHVKNSSLQAQNSSPVGGRNIPSILGNPNVSSTSSSGGGAKPQLQQQQTQQLQMQQIHKNLQQAQHYFSNNQFQSQSQHPGVGGTNSNPPPPGGGGGGGYYIQRWRQDQQQQQQLGAATSTASSSTGMLTSHPVSLSGGGTTDPAKAIAAATVAATTTMKGGYLQSHQLSSTAFSYGPTAPVTAQLNKPVEQKQQAGNDNLQACWQPEKK